MIFEVTTARGVFRFSDGDRLHTTGTTTPIREIQEGMLVAFIGRVLRVRRTFEPPTKREGRNVPNP